MLSLVTGEQYLLLGQEALPITRHGQQQSKLDHRDQDRRELIEVEYQQVDGQQVKQQRAVTELEAAALASRDQLDGGDNQQQPDHAFQCHADDEPGQAAGCGDHA